MPGMEITFGVDEGVTAQFPEAEIRLVAARGLRNDEPWDEVDAKLADLEAKVADGTWQPCTEEDPRIASWREAYRRFGTNPKKFRPSVEALSRRLRRTGSLPRISPAVDAYNFVSVTCGAPAGAFDIGGLSGQIIIRLGRGGDEFTPLGEPDVVEEPREGEVVYALGSTILTRHWNYRDAEATKVRPASREVVFMLERISAQAMGSARLAAAQASLAELIKPHAAEVELSAIPNAPAVPAP